MTLNAIRAMFTAGQVWQATNTYNTKASGLRTVRETSSTQVCWSSPLFPRMWMPFPKQSHVIEARPGYLSFQIVDHGTPRDGTLTLIQQPGAVQAN